MVGETLLFRAFSSDSALMTEGTYKLMFEKTDTAYTLNKGTFEYEKIVVDEYLGRKVEEWRFYDKSGKIKKIEYH